MLDPAHVLTTAPEPAFCPACELRHTRRPDWLCPRCGKPVNTEVPPPRARQASRDEDESYPVGSRIAGAIMLAAGGAIAVRVVRFPAVEHRWPLVAAIALLAVLGLGSLLKLSWARWAAVGAAAVAAVVLLEDLVRARLPDVLRDPVPLAIRAPVRDLIRPLYPATFAFVLALAAGGLLLLAGRPGRVRLAAGALLAAPLLVALALRAAGS